MRAVVIVLFLFLADQTGLAQEVKPVIVGQKELSTKANNPITIQLTDLYVEETPVETDDDGGNGGDGGGEDGGNDNGGSDGDSPDNGGDDNDSGEDEGDDKNDDGDKDNKGDKDERDNKDDKNDKGDKENKDDKDDKGNKGKGRNATTSFPEGYTLELFAGDNYSFSDNVVQPAKDFTGELTVPVRVSNAQHASPKFALKITVKAAPVVNQPPVITGQSPLTTSVDTPIQLKLSDLQVTDPDNEYPGGFTLTLQPGQNYLVSGSTVTPSAGFVGILTVPALVNDGKDNSPVYELRITVTASPITNKSPEITGQLPLSISMNQSIEIVLSQLLVNDPDNRYPEDFTLEVFPGTAYTLDAATVIPDEEFTGQLSVSVAVSDGVNDSKPFSLQITVAPAVNQVPVITGQAGLRILQGESLQIIPGHLVVQDPDSQYPDDFTLTVSPGESYSVVNNTVTPDPEFLGELTVAVQVHDGKAQSEPFALKVEVISPGNLEITGQGSVEIPEDSSFTIAVEDLIVNDPSKVYPSGFVVEIGNGSHYEVAGHTIRPERNYSGNLTLPVRVKNGPVSSSTFLFLVVVTPVNDAPELLHLAEDPLMVNAASPSPVFAGTEVIDVDNDHLLFAEIGFSEGNFIPGQDVLLYDDESNMRLVFDDLTGVLFVVGRGSIDDYGKLIHSVRYQFNGSPDSTTTDERRIFVKLNDGKSTSISYERVLMFTREIPLDIPSAFTPNNDNANDHWVITPMQQGEHIRAIVRVYNKDGILVFESPDLDQAWDGYHNGSPLPADVYFYTIEMDLSHRKLFYKGIVSILR